MSTSALYRLTVGAVAVVMSGGLIAQSARADTLDIDYLTSQGGNNTISNAAYAQSFSPTISGQLTSVGLVLQRVLPSPPSGTRLTIAVEGADSKVPNGVRLATASVLDSLIPDGKGEVTVNFTTPTSVEADNRYTLVLEAPAGTNYQWYFSNTLYAEEAWAYKPSGSNWGSANTDFTQAFGVYIAAAQPRPVAQAAASPAAHIQQFGLPDSQTCQEAAPEDLNWSGVGSGGWGQSWAQWMNDGLGGEVCTRMLVYSNAQDRWILAE